jgi:2-aminoadipate transaminase
VQRLAAATRAGWRSRSMSTLDAFFARRTRGSGAAELSAILAGTPPGVLSMTGGFPNPETFPSEELAEIAARLLRDDASVALQYTPCEGIASVREYLRDRQAQLHGRRPELEELIVTSGGMECLALAGHSLLDPGDAVAVEAPTYLGALMAFAGFEADVHGIPTDADGLIVEALEERLAAGLRPKFLYVIPEFQNPTGRTLPLPRRHALVECCRRHGVLILEDVAYRELPFDGESLPSLWSLAPEQVLQAGTFSKVFFPGVRLGWAVGPPAVVAQLAAAKQTTDQCAGALGQRMVEEYGRAGHFERRLPAAREFYAARWRALHAAFRRHLPPGVAWTEPDGGFLTWLTLPEGLDTVELRPAAVAAGVAYVPGRPFYSGEQGANELRLSFSHLSEAELDAAVERLAGVIRS